MSKFILRDLFISNEQYMKAPHGEFFLDGHQILRSNLNLASSHSPLIYFNFPSSSCTIFPYLKARQLILYDDVMNKQTTVFKHIDLRPVKHHTYLETLLKGYNKQKSFRHMVYKSLPAVYTSFVEEMDSSNFFVIKVMQENYHNQK